MVVGMFLNTHIIPNPMCRATQKLDHFNPQDGRTFQQRYWTSEQYYKGPNSPVFIFLGGESAGNSCDAVLCGGNPSIE